MTTISTRRHGERAAIFASLAPGEFIPDEITVRVTLHGANEATGTIYVLYYGKNKKTGERARRRTTQVWALAEHNLILFEEGDVQALIRGRVLR